MANNSLRANVVGILLGFGLLVPLAAQVVAAESDANRRQRCASNLRSTSQSMNVYGADNNDLYPALIPNSSTTYDVRFNDDVGSADPWKTIDLLYSQKKYPNNPVAPQWMIMLIGNSGFPPKQTSDYICPGDVQARAANLKKGNDFFLGFQDGRNISYSFPFPWTQDETGRTIVSPMWRAKYDASLPVIADMAPYLGKKAKAGEAATRPAGAKEADPIDDKWAVETANSPNHLFQGQNVAFNDAHVEFMRTPKAGQGNDSLWGLREKNGDKELPIDAGTLSHSPGGKSGAWDTVMVPSRDSKGNLK